MEYCHFINVDPETKQERMHHITPDFPYSADLCDLHIFPGNMFPWHWHRELEAFYMRRGSLTYHLPCGAVTFSQGEGGFINSNILHKTTCAPEDACIQEEQQFSPEFVGVNSLLLRKYVQPIVGSKRTSRPTVCSATNTPLQRNEIQKGFRFCCPLTGVTMAGYPAGVSGTSRVSYWYIAGNGSGYHWDIFVLFRFCCLSVLHAANVGIVDLHSLWCVLGPLYFFFMHHDLLDEEPQQLRCQRLNIRVPLRFVEERYRVAYRIFQPLDLCFSPRKGFCQFCLFIGVTGREQLELFCRDTAQHTVLIDDFLKIDRHGEYRLCCDIDFEGKQIPKLLDDFRGVLDGNGHKVKSLVISRRVRFDGEPVALFVSARNAEIKNPSTIGKHIIAPNYIGHQSVQILVEQKKLIEELAAQGDCVIVGRCADLILKEHQPLNIFVYADQESKAARCLERSDKSEKLSPDQLVRKMKEIDRNRASHRAMLASSRWGSKENYHLCINTSGKEIKALIPGLTAYVSGWFGAK